KVRTWVEMLRAQVPGMIARDVEMLNAIGREPQAA
ncbi:MAG: LysR family transcriptional regulator, partial [Burkholderia sp.]|nr:LysR family transcriptional regulator [Burkholderia sp.]